MLERLPHRPSPRSARVSSPIMMAGLLATPPAGQRGWTRRRLARLRDLIEVRRRDFVNVARKHLAPVGVKSNETQVSAVS